MTLYKVLNEDGSTYHGGVGAWPLPNGQPGEWMPRIAPPLAPCERGYHVLHREMLVQWLGPAIFEVEVRGEEIWQSDKGVAEQARLVRKLENWNERTARLFACDCAEKVVHLAKDERSVNAIKVARRFAFNLATKEELAAARAAARTAARNAARDAARAAARAAALTAAWDAARNAARDAARAAAWNAARNAAWNAQTNRLFEYLEGQVDLEAIRTSVV